ncbi:PAS domain S-box protein [candidate division KSB1 bacterium]|nr:PAS domain S-box protein [candidate division KSB1 bacterium]
MSIHDLLHRTDVPPDAKDILRQFIIETADIHKELQQSEQRYRFLVQTIPDIVYMIDENGVFTFVNDSIKGLGYKPDELIGKHFSEILHPEDVEKASSATVLEKYRGKVVGNKEHPKLFDERRTGDRKTTNLELRLVSKKAETKTGLMETVTKVAASGMYDRDVTSQEKVFLGTIGVIRDITELKQAEEELKASQRKVEYLEQFLRVCAGCHKIHIPRTDDNQMGNWMQMEEYIMEKTSTIFSHGLCPDCFEREIGKARSMELGKP